MNITVDKEKCIGCGSCAAIAPNVFKMGDDGKAEVIDGPPAQAGDHSGDEALVNQAKDACPVQAIVVE